MSNIERELKIIELYKEGATSKQICKECRCSTNTISKLLVKYNIPKRQPRCVKKDLSKFYNLNSPETQYWLGFICADGNIEYNPESRIYKVSLFSKDKEVIDKYSTYFKDCGVKQYIRKQNGILEASIHSKELCEYLINQLNITPNKSLTLNPNIKYTTNFILGYFDGDGCIRNSNETQTRYECNITCASKVFINKIKEILDKQNIHSIIYKHTDCNAYKIRIDRKEDSKKFYKWLYKDMVVCLSRKLNNFVALYGNIKNDNRENCGNIQENPQPSLQVKLKEGSTTNS